MAVLRSCHDEPWCGFHAFTATCPARPPIAGSAQQGRAPSSTSTTTDPLAVSCPAEQRPVGIALWLQVRAWALSTNGSPTPVTPTRLAESRGDSSTWESGTRRPDRPLSRTPETTRDQRGSRPSTSSHRPRVRGRSRRFICAGQSAYGTTANRNAPPRVGCNGGQNGGHNSPSRPARMRPSPAGQAVAEREDVFEGHASTS